MNLGLAVVCGTGVDARKLGVPEDGSQPNIEVL